MKALIQPLIDRIISVKFADVILPFSSKKEQQGKDGWMEGRKVGRQAGHMIDSDLASKNETVLMCRLAQHKRLKRVQTKDKHTLHFSFYYTLHF